MKPLNSIGLKTLFVLLFSHIFIFSQAQTVSRNILTDQFGYRPEAEKIAVIKNPQLGDDSKEQFTPGSVYKVVDKNLGVSVFQNSLSVFNNGLIDTPSGDKIWWFDFSSVSTPGEYYILDEKNNVRSNYFSIKEDVYDEVLKHALRMFFYQRAGCEKKAQYAGADWADGASHIGPGQDKNCRLYSQKNSADTERDLHGGWYDAGDFNKYTNWACSYIEIMMLCYLENPQVWMDNYNIPESGNGIPDLLDEAKWGMDWLLRMQQTDGSVLSVVGLDHAFPPSKATGASYYGPASTSASWSAAKALAIGSKVYGQIGMTEYAEQLRRAALKAWSWAEANPNVIFHNNSSSNGSTGLGAGDQEVTEDYRRLSIRLSAALYLYEMTGEKTYLDLFDNNYRKLPLLMWNNFVSQYWADDQFMFLYYLNLDGANESVKTAIKNALKTGFNNSGNYSSQIGKDGYRSFIESYNWGSNKYKSDYGNTFYIQAIQSLEPGKDEIYKSAAEDYLHYIHGVNPMGLVYLTNMNAYGASNSLTEIYHSWFDHNSALWNKVTATSPGPAPGYLAGGANEFYSWDGCCPSGCGSPYNNTLCLSEEVPVDQPPAKMYKDFNTNWPLNSWQITEPMGAYQVAYIRLLSKFVSEKQGADISSPSVMAKKYRIYPNPSADFVNVRVANCKISQLRLYDLHMKLLKQTYVNREEGTINVSSLPPGIYVIQIETPDGTYADRVIIR